MTEGVGSMQALMLKQNISFTLTVTFEPLGSFLYCLTNLCIRICFITPHSAQISASKFQTLGQIPLKICSVWKSHSV